MRKKKVLTVTQFAQMGGKARAAKMSPEELKASAMKAARAAGKVHHDRAVERAAQKKRKP